MNLEKLLNSLTLDEKIGQLVMIAPHFFIKDSHTEIAGPLADLGINQDQIFQTGSVLGIGSASEMIEVQRKYLEKSRHKIPLIFMADIIHGYQTIFPVPLGLASTWNDELVELSARISAIEASTAGIHVTFAPMVDLVKDPRWGRVVESFGEDPYMAQRFAMRQVKGFQGDDVSKEDYIAACVKHFAAYGAGEAGRDYNTVDLSRLNLHQNYLKGYKAAVDAGAKLVMTSFNLFEGVPATTNKYLLDEILRNDWKFKGVVISDYASLKETLMHGTASDGYDAAVQGINAGLDIEMATALYIKNLKQAVLNKDVSIETIDKSVMYILQLKKDCGLFENPYKGANLVKEKTLVRHENHMKQALKVAEESIVLLKNEKETLPIKAKSIALIGRYASNTYTNGPWSWHGDIHKNETILNALNQKINVVYSNDGMSVDYDKLANIEHIILAIGEDQNQSGEAHSRANIKLPFDQEQLVKNIRKHSKYKITLVLFNGRPLDLSEVVDEVDAIVEAYFPGSMTAEALTNILMGTVNPSGKLTMSFPRSIGQVPIYYNHLNTGRPGDKKGEYTSHYMDEENTPLFDFGFGLSYAKFTYSNLNLSQLKMQPNETLKISVDIQNTSNVDGKEVVQVYIRDYVAKVSRPLKELINFKKVMIKANEKVTVSFEINIEDLMYFGQDLKERFDKGLFKLMVGGSSNKTLDLDFELL